MWSIEYEASPAKFLKKCDKQTAIKILKYLKKIQQNPRIHGKALTSDLHGLWRYRIGDYRVICELSDNKLLVLVIDIGHRREVYS